MPYQKTISQVKSKLENVFAELDIWFDRSDSCRRFVPQNGGWSIDQVLEHVTMTNHFLMLTLRKYVGIALRRASKLTSPISDGESDLSRIEVIGERGSFGWPRPVHMEPVGIPASEVRETMKKQRVECLNQLTQLEDGIGSLCTVSMSVNKLGKIDLYQWLYFIAQHGRRHLQQMRAIETEFGK